MYKRYDLEKIAEEYGINNLRFFIPMRRVQSLHGLGLPIGIIDSSTPEVMQECIVDERRYKVADGYKIELHAVNSTEENYFGSKTYYQTDLESMLREERNDIRLFVLVDADDKYERIQPEVYIDGEWRKRA
jgi:hypothetical protein